MSTPHDHKEEAAAGAAGAAASGGAYQVGGFKMKLLAQRKGSKAPAGISRSKYEKTIKEHQRAHGAYHGGEPTWLGQRGRVGHTVGLVTGQGPTAHVNAARHWPTKVEGVSVPGAKVRRVMGYTHGGKTGLAVGAAASALGVGAAAGAMHHHLNKSEPLAIAGSLRRAPSALGEFRRGVKGSYRGKRTVARSKRNPEVATVRNSHGYPTGKLSVLVDRRSYTGAAYADALDRAARTSSHRTSFSAGAKAGESAAAIAAHPHATVATVGGSAALVHHARNKETNVSKLIAKSGVCKNCATCKDAACSCATCKSRKMSKSAFGVEDARLAKGTLTSGVEAIKGFKGGFGGMIGAEKTGAGVAGKAAGAATMGKLKPIGAALAKTPARLATTSALGGLGVGLAAGDGKKNN